MHDVMSAGEFKSRCLKVMDEVQETGIEHDRDLAVILAD